MESFREFDSAVWPRLRPTKQKGESLFIIGAPSERVLFHAISPLVPSLGNVNFETPHHF